jgi:glycosyltransferase involved in cell wall biosynthesis
MPTKLVKIELDKSLPQEIENAQNYQHVWLIVMRQGIPIGRVVIDNLGTPVLKNQIESELSRQLYWSLVWNKDLSDEANLAEVLGLTKKIPSDFEDEPELVDLLPELKPKTGQNFFLSIVICTYDRPTDLEKCLESMQKLETGRHKIEILVVDNHPSSGLTLPVVEKFKTVRYETETRPGVSYARNKGLRDSRGEIVAYIDDDVVLPSGWVKRILAPFTDERVMCVSGLVLPLELETESQELFEMYGGLGRGFSPRIFDTAFFNQSKRHVVPTWDLGGTANVAIRKTVIAQSGMFDETLGPGLPTGVGEDIYMFYQILKFGHICYYEPAAYVWHKHRRTLKELKRQLYGYNKGQTSYQLRTLVSDGDTRALWQLFFDLPIWHLKRFIRILQKRNPYPLYLLWEEVRGNLVGFYAFNKAVKMHRKLNGLGANPIKSKTK